MSHFSCKLKDGDLCEYAGRKEKKLIEGVRKVDTCEFVNKAVHKLIDCPKGLVKGGINHEASRGND